MAIALAPVAARAQDQWDRANAAVLRLAPSAFSELPKPIRSELERRSCTIPQTYVDSLPHNVIRGHFGPREEIDWAVLCSRNDTSTILVFWAGSASEVDDLASLPDRYRLQGIGGGRIGFSRLLDVADSTYIIEHYERYGGPVPPPLYHQGIDDIFTEKASVIWYWHEGRWLQLTGAD